MDNNMTWYAFLMKCYETHNVDLDHMDCKEIADEILLKDAKIKELQALKDRIEWRIGELEAWGGRDSKSSVHRAYEELKALLV